MPMPFQRLQKVSVNIGIGKWLHEAVKDFSAVIANFVVITGRKNQSNEENQQHQFLTSS